MSCSFFVRWAAITVIVGQACGYGQATDLPTTAAMGAELLKYRALLGAQQSLTISATRTVTASPDFVVDGVTGGVYRYKLNYQGKLFQYDVQVQNTKVATYSNIECFDGERYFLFNRLNRVLTLASTPFVNDIVMREGHVAFMPFLFVMSEFQTNPFAQLSYEHLSSPENWAGAAKEMEKSSSAKLVTMGERQYLMAKMGGGIDAVSKEPFSFYVYFDPTRAGYPMRWEKRTSEGVLTADYTVEQLEKAALSGKVGFPYPKKAVMRTFVKGKVESTSVYEIQDLLFNAKIDDEVFTIDPAVARKIRDGDSGVVIQIPQ